MLTSGYSEDIILSDGKSKAKRKDSLYKLYQQCLIICFTLKLKEFRVKSAKLSLDVTAHYLDRRPSYNSRYRKLLITCLLD